MRVDWTLKDGAILNEAIRDEKDCHERKIRAVHFPEEPLSPIDCLELARHIVRIWKIVGVLLGFDLPTLDEIEMDNPYNSKMQATMLLIRWTEWAASEANMNNLLPVLHRLNINYPI